MTTRTNSPSPILRDEMLEPRGQTAFSVDRGQTPRIIDVDGQQVADFETALLIAISNCPQERNPCNAYKPTRLRVVVFGGGTA
jgi:uncharacterized protein YcgI (DUF1989 family)